MLQDHNSVYLHAPTSPPMSFESSPPSPEGWAHRKLQRLWELISGAYYYYSWFHLPYYARFFRQRRVNYCASQSAPSFFPP